MGSLGALFGHRRARGRTALGEHGLHGGDELGSLHHFDLGVQLRPRYLAEAVRQGQQRSVVGRFGRFLGLCGRRTAERLLLQGLGEGVRPPVCRNVCDHWRHLLSS